MSRLPQVRHQLLVLHRTLLAAERVAYERVHGRVSAGAFLELVVGAPQFAWLQPMTALIVALDEALELAQTTPGDEARELEAATLADARKLLVAELSGHAFAQKYAACLQASADVAFEHGAMMRLLPP